MQLLLLSFSRSSQSRRLIAHLVFISINVTFEIIMGTFKAVGLSLGIIRWREFWRSRIETGGSSSGVEFRGCRAEITDDRQIKQRAINNEISAAYPNAAHATSRTSPSVCIFRRELWVQATYLRRERALCYVPAVLIAKIWSQCAAQSRRGSLFFLKEKNQQLWL